MKSEIAAEPAVALNTQWREGYSRNDRVDEMLSAKGEIQPQWRKYVDWMDNLGAVERRRRWEFARRLIRENGVSYNVYGDQRGMDRPWLLDAVPLFIDGEQWNGIERALAQRARLLDAVLRDIYGPQKLLNDGVLPAELVFANPGFLRPAHGLSVPGDCHLHLYSADIGRGPDGNWTVISNRTQAPAGAGYALENRIVLSRVFPEIFKECQVQRLANFFRKLRQTLAALAPFNRDNPRIVLLTPGPYNETYFEHAYLARYLNYTLVEGGDLTVRDQCVFLKTLGGLHRVDVILRRLDDDYCDPLELRPDSFAGVTGLVQALRAGNVAVSNALGSGIVESPGWNPFLPKLCQHMLGESLAMPSVETFWCGEKSSLNYVLEHLSTLVIKPVFPKRGLNSVFGAKLTQPQREDLRAKIKARPTWYVAQRQFDLSTAPVLVEDSVQPRHTVVRTFLVRSEATYMAMPGGLTQIPIAADTLDFSLQRGAGSKDTWIQAAGPVSTFSLLRPVNAPLELSRGGGDLPSRVADNLFWLGRYVERAESTVRLMRGIAHRLTEKSALNEVRELPLLFAALRQQGGISWDTPNAATKSGSFRGEMRLLLDESFARGGLYATLQGMQSVARMLRDRISIDTWRILNNLNEDAVWPRTLNESRWSEVSERLNNMVVALASFGGLASESMTRGQVWLFMEMGRRLERALNTARLLRSTLVPVTTEDSGLLEGILEVADGLMTYRRRYLANLQVAPVLDLLLADETNPRSVAFQLVMLSDHVERLPRDNARVGLGADERITVGTLAELRLLEVDALCEMTLEKQRANLLALLVRVDDRMTSLSDIVTRQYLSHAERSRQLAAFRSEV